MRSVLAGVAVSLFCAACIPDFGLESRTFLADASVADTGEHRDAGAGDAAERDAGERDAEEPDAGARDADPADTGRPEAGPEVCDNLFDDDRDGFTDCADTMCGSSWCSDNNVCTTDTCVSPSGECQRVNNTMSGGLDGWECRDGMKHETICNDTSDNDQDGMMNCSDLADCCSNALCNLAPGC